MDKIVQTYDGTRIILLCPEFAALNFKGKLMSWEFFSFGVVASAWNLASKNSWNLFKEC